MTHDPHTRILFFGSTNDSIFVLSALKTEGYDVLAVVTQPPKPIGRTRTITPTPVQILAEQLHIPVLSFQTDPDSPINFQTVDQVIATLSDIPYTLIVSASYGQLIPWSVIQNSTYGGLNIHPSLLPRWRGADPTPWSLLAGDNETGVTIVGLSESFDQGKIYAQHTIPVPLHARPTELRSQLFQMGAELLLQRLPAILDKTIKGYSQDSTKAAYARRLTRTDGFIEWSSLKKALNNEPLELSDLPLVLQEAFRRSKQGDISQLTQHQKIAALGRMITALSPWPGMWTTVNVVNKPEPVRMKILSGKAWTHESFSPYLSLSTVQFEGKTPQEYNAIKRQII